MVARGLWWPGAYGGQGLMVARGQGHLAIWNLHVWGNLHESEELVNFMTFSDGLSQKKNQNDI